MKENIPEQNSEWRHPKGTVYIVRDVHNLCSTSASCPAIVEMLCVDTYEVCFRLLSTWNKMERVQ